ncbi:protein NRT1/ PTR FAMILY 5.5-like [Coffea arabica]|uniref:Protein NRT1/ PTR FAMILY 5.5-like n=1 Tax=Coffea arabica TaxID=13443 RepID=A0ABM4W7Y4_COFAR
MLALAQNQSGKLLGTSCIILVPVIGLIALPYIKPWSLRFGIPTICTLVATLAFVQGTQSCNKEENRPAEGSPVTNVFRVFVASTLKMFEDPKRYSELYGKQSKGLLSFLDKATIPLTTEIEEPEKYRWRLCTRTEVEETKIIIRMIPIWITFVICGVITSVGNTYFVEQANHMNYKIGKLKLPDSVILVFYEISKSQFKSIYDAIGRFLRGERQEKYAPSIGIALATIFSVLCCITAAGIETRRIHVIRSHGLLDKPDDKIPLSALVLLP